jgi:methylisocitrate lyase
MQSSFPFKYAHDSRQGMSMVQVPECLNGANGKTAKAVQPPKDVTYTFHNSRGKIPSASASALRTLWLDCYKNPETIAVSACSMDGLTSRLVEEAGFPFVFLSGYSVSSGFGLPDAGYIAFEEMAHMIQSVVRVVNIPIIVDGDTGYGNAMNVRRTVQGFAAAGAAGIMIEDQTWPKRCGHVKGKTVVSREEAFARVQAAVDARDEGQDMFILARTDSYMLGYDEAVFRAQKFVEIGADAVFIEALPDKETMARAIRDVPAPMLANIIEEGLTENLSAKVLAELGFSAVAYPWRVSAAKIKGIRDGLETLKQSLTTGAPPVILHYDELCKAVGFTDYWALEDKYKHSI